MSWTSWEVAAGRRSGIFGGGRGYSRTSYNSPSGGVTSGMESLVNKYNQAYQQAQATNQKLYQDMLGIADKTTGQRMADVRTAYAQQGAQQQSQLQRQGLGATTVGSTLAQGNIRDREASLNRTADQMQQTRLGIMGQFGQQALPDRSSIQGLFSSIASQYGGGQGIQALLNAVGGMSLGNASAQAGSKSSVPSPLGWD